MTTARTRRRRMLRAMLSRRRRFTTDRFGTFETPTETRIIHEIPRTK